jgi:hypothetical protein
MTVLMTSTLLHLLLCAAVGPDASQGRPISQDDQAEQAFHQGVDAARQEHWMDARAHFERAYELSPRPVVLINLAGAQARSGRLTEAAKNYHRILEDRSMPDTAPFRQAARDVLPALEARIPRIRLAPSGLGAGDTIEIDGQVVSLTALDSGYPLDPGAHTLVVKRANLERARVLFSLAERERHDITLPLPLIPSAPAPSPAISRSQLLASSETPSPPRRRWWASPWTWTGAAVIVAGATALLIAGTQRGGGAFSGNVPPGILPIK